MSELKYSYSINRQIQLLPLVISFSILSLIIVQFVIMVLLLIGYIIFSRKSDVHNLIISEAYIEYWINSKENKEIVLGFPNLLFRSGLFCDYATITRISYEEISHLKMNNNSKRIILIANDGRKLFLDFENDKTGESIKNAYNIISDLINGK